MRAAKARPGCRILSVAQCCDEYGFTRSQLYSLVALKKWPALEIPSTRRILLDRRDLEAFIEKHKTTAAA